LLQPSPAQTVVDIQDLAMANFLPLPDAVAQNLKSGDTVAFEGFTHLIPHASAHEAIRQDVRDLTLVRMTPDVIYDQLIGMGMVRKLIFSYAGNPGVGLLRRLRDAVENGWPHRIEIEEHSHAAMANAYEAGAAGLPFATFRGYKGAELARVNRTSARSPAPSPASNWRQCLPSGPMSASSTPRKPTARAMS
jgi:glutaconate CoA-transferase subunit A